MRSTDTCRTRARRNAIAATAARASAFALALTLALALPGAATAAPPDAGATRTNTTGSGAGHEELLAAMAAEAGTARGGDGIPGIIARVHRDGVDWTGTARSDAGAPDRDPDRPYRAGSITKLFVATTVLQLVAEGRLKLSDDVFGLLGPVLKANATQGCNPYTWTCFDPPGPGKAPITVRDLLTHSSGVFNYLRDTSFLAEAGPAFPALPDYTPQRLVDEGANHGPQFAPGRGMEYSNTNYILLGMVVEKVTGQPWAEEIGRRIIRPLGLSRTVLPGSDPVLPGPHDAFFTNYLQPRGALGHLSRPAADWNPSIGGAAGAVVSTTGDLVTFIRALLGGTLLPPRQLTDMRELLNANVVGTPGPGVPGISCDPQLAWPECVVNPRISTANTGDTAAAGHWYADQPWKSIRADVGLGLVRRTLTCADDREVRLYGHNGAAFGSFSYLYATEDGSHALALNYNGDWPKWELYSLNGLLAAEFCTT
ncbi:serine hydrolase domain-containing protein [Streptomyces sp. NPDC097619]|uniref:serine hydrolase domain-containing protein n=1 Tax=Streptomyces sp. NPDC097619 TaxID=3157228 RepID=UPI003322F95F